MDDVGRFDATKGSRIVGPRDGVSVDLGSISARSMVWGEEVGWRTLAAGGRHGSRAGLVRGARTAVPAVGDV